MLTLDPQGRVLKHGTRKSNNPHDVHPGGGGPSASAKARYEEGSQFVQCSHLELEARVRIFKHKRRKDNNSHVVYLGNARPRAQVRNEYG